MCGWLQCACDALICKLVIKFSASDAARACMCVACVLMAARSSAFCVTAQNGKRQTNTSPLSSEHRAVLLIPRSVWRGVFIAQLAVFRI